MSITAAFAFCQVAWLALYEYIDAILQLYAVSEPHADHQSRNSVVDRFRHLRSGAERVLELTAVSDAGVDSICWFTLLVRPLETPPCP